MSVRVAYVLQSLGTRFSYRNIYVRSINPRRFLTRTSFIKPRVTHSLAASSCLKRPLYSVTAAPLPASPHIQPLCFDKIPEKLPDWWDEEDDEDDDADGKKNPGDSDEAQFWKKGGTGGSGDDGTGGGGRGDDSSGPNSGDGPGKQGLLAALFAGYMKALQRRPIPTKAITTCILALMGDLVAQLLAQQGHQFTWDSRRTFAVGTWGLLFLGPLLHFWYGMLDRFCVGRFALWTKLLCDQLFFAPFANGTFIIGTSVLEGRPFRESVVSTKNKMWPTMKANWSLWPAAQFINFKFVPSELRVIYVNMVALVWNVILTYISHEEDGSGAKAAQ